MKRSFLLVLILLIIAAVVVTAIFGKTWIGRFGELIKALGDFLAKTFA